MKTKFYSIFILATTLLFTSSSVISQTLTEITGKRLYEHHSASIAGGSGANGVQSGYDFVNNAYYNSFDPSTFSGWTGGQEANIDMVEHNGPATSGGNFGFTSAVSTIWGGQIQGNNSSIFMQAPSTFQYSSAANVSDIANAFDTTIATKEIPHVTANTVYLGKIRNSDLYVAIKVTNVVNKPMYDYSDTYFDFDYKYGNLSSGVGIFETKGNTERTDIYPNPFNDNLYFNIEQIDNIDFITISDITGKAIKTIKPDSQILNLGYLDKGIYFLTFRYCDGVTEVKKTVKQ